MVILYVFKKNYIIIYENMSFLQYLYTKCKVELLYLMLYFQYLQYVNKLFNII